MFGELQTWLLEICNIHASKTTIRRTLQRRGFRRKMVRTSRPSPLIVHHHTSHRSKITRPALERNEHRRAVYKVLVGEQYQPQQLVFVDESHFNRMSLRRRWGWAPCGRRARRRDFFIRGIRFVLSRSVLPSAYNVSLDTQSFPRSLSMAFYILPCKTGPSPATTSSSSLRACWTRCVHGQSLTQSLSWTMRLFIAFRASVS